MKIRPIWIIVLSSIVGLLWICNAFAVTRPILKWRITLDDSWTGNEILGSPALGKDGIIYVGAGNGKFYAVNSAGKIQWETKLSSLYGAYGTPSIASDGTIYVGCGGTLYAINPGGDIKWSILLDNSWQGASIAAPPAIAHDGTIYVGAGDCAFYAINPDGTEKWRFQFKFSSNIFTPAAIAHDGTIYVGAPDGKLYAFNPDGTIKWSFVLAKVKYCRGGAPTIDSDGTIYIGSTCNRKMFAINPDGTEKWEVYVGIRGNYRQPVIGNNGLVYVIAKDDLYLFDKDTGNIKWYEPPNPTAFRSQIGIDSNGYIYSTREDGFLLINTPQGPRDFEFTETKVDRYPPGLFFLPISSPLIAPDGTIYYGTLKGELIAVQTDCGGLAKTPWPMLGKNTRHTGNAEDE
jgi:outer membrane protein assembly factor BamB